MKTKPSLKMILEPLPPPLAARFSSCIMLGAGCFAVGILLLCVYGLSSIGIILFPSFLGLIIAGYGLYYKIRLLSSGWIEMTGTCTTYYDPHLLPTTRRGAYAFLVSTEDAETVFVPTTKRDATPPIGSYVTVYIGASADLYYMGQNGARHYSNIYGYAFSAGTED